MTIPIALVGGFLGSGKTTLLKRFLDGSGDRKILFLVNEFANDEIDATLLTEAGGMAWSVSGGSVFCVCKADEFKERLIEALRMPDLEGVIVEASGMAEPRAMGKILGDPRLSGKLVLTSLIAVVDPATFVKLVHTLPAVQAQVREADRIVINKCDIATTAQLESLSRQLREINDGAEIMEAIRCCVAIDPLQPHRIDGHGLAADLTTCGDRDFASLLVTFEQPVKFNDLRLAIDDLGSLTARVKGWLNTPDRGRLFVELAGRGGFTSEPANPGPSRFAVIVAINAQQATQNRLSRIPGCRFL